MAGTEGSEARGRVSRRAGVLGDVRGGVTAAVIALPVAISCGYLAFSPLGPAYAPAGALAGLFTVIVASALAAWLGGQPVQITGPKSALAVVFASVLAGLLEDPLLPAGEAARIATALALSFLCVAMAGLIQIALGLLRLGSVIKFLPYPVTAGFMNGLAVIIVLGQLPVLAGGGWRGLADPPLAVLAVAAVTVAAMALARRRLKSGGDALIGLGAGVAAHYALAAVFGDAAVGAVIGAVPQALPVPDALAALAPLAGAAEAWHFLGRLIGPALIMAVIGAIDSLLGAAAADALGDSRHDSNRELIGQGVGNIGAGLVGGIPAAGAIGRTVASVRAGGRTRLAGVAHGAAALLFTTALAPLVGHVPLAATAGILLVYAAGMADDWTRRLVVRAGRARDREGRNEALVNLAVVLVVTALTVLANLVVAVVVGFVAASFLFVVKSGQSPVYRHYRADQVHSKNARPLAVMEFLRARGRAIVVVEAQGPIFFGSADRLAGRLEALGADARLVILDLKRVTDIDATGANILMRLQNAFMRRGKSLLIGHLAPDMPEWGFLADAGVVRDETRGAIFPDADRALAFAENALIAEEADAARQAHEVPLAGMEVLRGMDADQLAALAARLRRRAFAAGDRVFAAGDPGDAMYFLTRGSVSVMAALPGTTRTTRLAGIGPGVTFGEMALLTDKPRSAAIVADEDVVCHALSTADFEDLARARPDVVIRLLLNLSRETANRLEFTSEEVVALEK